MSEPVIIQVSVNGVDHARIRHAPSTPEEIITDVSACLDAGAAIVHNHIDLIRVRGVESAERYLEAWRPILAKWPDALLTPTTNWEPGGAMTYDHIEPLVESGALRIAFTDMQSFSTIRNASAGIICGDAVYGNTYDAINERFERSRRLQLGTSVQVTDLSALRNVALWAHIGKLPRGCWINLYFSADPHPDGSPGFMSMPPTASVLDVCVEMIKASSLPWAASLWGGDLVRSGFGRLVLERGGHLSIGLEHFYGTREPTNIELVHEAIALCATVSRKVANSSEAARIFDIPLPPRPLQAISKDRYLGASALSASPQETERSSNGVTLFQHRQAAGR